MVMTDDRMEMRMPDALARLKALQAELAELATATAQARRCGDVIAWMRLLTRGEELPGEIAAAEAALAGQQSAPHDLAAA